MLSPSSCNNRKTVCRKLLEFQERVHWLLRTGAAQEILFAIGNVSGWAHGGCLVLAKALHQLLEEQAIPAPIYALFSTTGNGVQHYVVGFQDGYLDSEGVHSQSWLENEYAANLVLANTVPEDPDILCPTESVLKLREFLALWTARPFLILRNTNEGDIQLWSWEWGLRFTVDGKPSAPLKIVLTCALEDEKATWVVETNENWRFEGDDSSSEDSSDEEDTRPFRPLLSPQEAAKAMAERGTAAKNNLEAFAQVLWSAPECLFDDRNTVAKLREKDRVFASRVYDALGEHERYCVGSGYWKQMLIDTINKCV